MTPQQPVQGISISELTEKLKLSRNYITRNITHCIPHLEESPSKGARVIFDETTLRDYLVQKCTFTRQTRRINLEREIQKYIAAHPNDERLQKSTFREDFIGKIPDWNKAKRSELPAIPLKATDFWDFSLIFSKEYTQGDESPDAPRKSAEICYRDMFKIGAIKIQLGRQKTMFYIPYDEDVCLPPLNQLSKINNNDETCFLVPADWEPFYQGHKEPSSQDSTISKIQITITADEKNFDQGLIEKALRKGFALEHVLSHNIAPADNQVSVTYQGTPLINTSSPSLWEESESVDEDDFMRDYEQSLNDLKILEDRDYLDCLDTLCDLEYDE